MNVLAIDIGGTHVKILATGQKERREFESGPKLTPKLMFAGVNKLAWPATANSETWMA
jgi:polyphosphate glucokinase